jgi:hypothetical protein
MTRLVLISGVLAVAFGVTVIIPALAENLNHGLFSGLVGVVVSFGIMLILGGGAAILFARRHPSSVAMPAPVRATVMAAILFLAFCMLEFSDGLLRQDGRIFYWTSVLFLPALVLLYGLVSAHRWAWWVTRVAAALAVLWFVAFMVIIPFADLRADGVSTPLRGRLYMEAVTLVFAGISFYVFRCLGRAEAKNYFANHIRTNVA